VASVAADPSAIAPPLPPPGRPDAAPPAGPSGAFADLLDATGPASPQAQATASGPAAPARSGDGSTPAQGGAVTGKDAAAVTTAGTGKDAGNAKGTKDEKDIVGDSAGVSPPVDVTIVAGLAIPVLPLDLPAAAGGSAPTTGAAQSASFIPATPADGNATSRSTDIAAPSAKAGQIAAGLVAPLPAISPTPAITPASPESAPVRIGSDTTPAPASPISAAASPVNASPPAAVPDTSKIDSAAPPQANRIALPNPLAPTDIQNLGPVAPAVGSMPPPAADLQAASIAASNADPAAPADQNAKPPASPPAAVISPSANPLSTLTVLAPVNPAPVTPSSATTQVADQPAGNAGAYIEAEAIPVALSAQAAVKFAAPLRASGDGASQTASDNPPDSADGVGGAPAAGNGQPMTTAAPSFNLAIATPHQAAPSEWTSPQRAAAPSDTVSLAGVPIAIATRVEAGERKFEIRLDPPDLGRIEVRLNVDASGRATSHLVVDRADTLDLLRRDAPALERALQSAGLTTDDGALQFSLRDQSFAGRDQGAPAPLAPPTPAAGPESDLAPIDATVRRYGPPAGLGGGIDIRV
jgi:flagellar hook-length control protein FliK